MGLACGWGHALAGPTEFDFGNGICRFGFWRTGAARHGGCGGDKVGILGRSAPPLLGSLEGFEGAIEPVAFGNE